MSDPVAYSWERPAIDGSIGYIWFSNIVEAHDYIERNVLGAYKIQRLRNLDGCWVHLFRDTDMVKALLSYAG